MGDGLGEPVPDQRLKVNEAAKAVPRPEKRKFLGSASQIMERAAHCAKRRDKNFTDP
jgi:hypothetical protein